jgi:uncharacterized protein YccT (UPF0319 family)
MIDALFAPVLVAAGFNETDHAAIVNDAGNAYDAVSEILKDKQLAKTITMLTEMLEKQARTKNAATEPKPVPGESPDSDRYLTEWAEWFIEVQKQIAPYSAVTMAVQMLQPPQRGALREKVLAKMMVRA